jgi:hypothetical protein
MRSSVRIPLVCDYVGCFERLRVHTATGCQQKSCDVRGSFVVIRYMVMRLLIVVIDVLLFAMFDILQRQRHGNQGGFIMRRR